MRLPGSEKGRGNFEPGTTKGLRHRNTRLWQATALRRRFQQLKGVQTASAETTALRQSANLETTLSTKPTKEFFANNATKCVLYYSARA